MTSSTSLKSQQNEKDKLASKQTDESINKTRKKRCIDYIVESENQKADNEKTAGVQRWLKSRH